jgi:5-(carboxyamino)imidazole ribonucleotide mutase
MNPMCNVPTFLAVHPEHYSRTRRSTMAAPLVGVVMGSKSDWGVMTHTVSTLESLNIPHEARVMSAHRTPDVVAEYAAGAEARGIEVIIAAAGGAAHLAGVVASMTTIPVLGVPMVGWALDGLDSLLSTVQMPRGIPVATVAIGKAGAVNSALLAGQILGLKHPEIRDAVIADREARRQAAMADSDPTI